MHLPSFSFPASWVSLCVSSRKAAWFFFLLLSSCASHDHRQAKAILESHSQALKLETGPEPLLPLVPLTALEREARAEEIFILTLRGLIK